MPTCSLAEFNAEVKEAIDKTILDILGEDVRESLYTHLQRHHRISADEVPYRVDTLFEVFQRTFGVAGARTLTGVIAKRIYLKFNLPFTKSPSYRLQDYLERAKSVLVSHSSDAKR